MPGETDQHNKISDWLSTSLREVSEGNSGGITAILDAINEPLFIVDPDKKIIYFNSSAEELTGFSRDEVLNQPCILGIRCANCLSECALFEQKKLRNRKLLIHTKDGRTIQILKNAEVLTDKNGKIIGGVETFRDVTRANKHRQRVHSENQSFKSVLNHMDQGVIVADAQRNIVLCNNYLSEEFAHSTQHMKGHSLFDYFPDLRPEDLMKPDALIERTTRFTCKDGRYHLVHVKPLEIEDNHSGDADLMLLVRKVRNHERLHSMDASEYAYYGMISRTPAMLEIFNLCETIGDSDVSVLIQGESGTGKEALARAIHDSSSRKQKPFHVVNCAVFNENLLESELFGHCRGAFTGAVSDKIGRFELADKGTLFLDEIGEMPPNLQVKLLRFLQDQQFERVGEWKTRQVDVRIIAATNRRITEQIEKGEFRDDLFYRINVIPVFLPPLRERTEDIPLLLEFFIKRMAEQNKTGEKVLSHETLRLLRQYQWPGNIRELQNVVLHAITTCKETVILPRHLPRGLTETSGNGGNGTRPALAEQPSGNVGDLERESIVNALRKHNFNRSQAAESLSITRTTLWRKMKKHGLL